MKKKVLYIFLVLMLLAAVIAFSFYKKIYGNNLTQETELFIEKGASIEEVVSDLNPNLKSSKSFVWVAKKMSYKNPKSGRYVLKAGLSNRKIIQKLRIGDQDPLTLTFNNQDNIYKLAGRLAEQIQPDSLALLNSFLDKNFLQQQALNQDNLLSIFIPNSYEVFWNISADKIRDKMLREYQIFWNDKRLKKADLLGLNPMEVMTLASIVQKETSTVAERPKVAGLYLNRLNINMPLQADPTIIFALKKIYGNDIEIKRVRYKHLTVDSPYNTYRNQGLPPNLISMPDVSSIEAVLNPAHHDYLYMCASTTNLGQHEFAKSLAQHNRNAAKYSAWADKQGL